MIHSKPRAFPAPAEPVSLEGHKESTVAQGSRDTSLNATHHLVNQ